MSHTEHRARRASASALIAATIACAMASCAPRPDASMSAPESSTTSAQQTAPLPTTEVPSETRGETTGEEPSETPRSTATEGDSGFITVSPLIRVNVAAHIVELTAVTVLDVGFLEQLVCQHGTREHESLFAFEGSASEVHAALLLAGFVAGQPGSWREERRSDGTLDVVGVPPSGSELSITVRTVGTSIDGAARTDASHDEHSIEWFVRALPLGEVTSHSPPSRFNFAGSRFHRDRRTGVERYVADGSGSIVGLVTFGDETIGCAEVIPDQASVASPQWEVFTERMPKLGERVTVQISLRNTAQAQPTLRRAAGAS